MDERIKYEIMAQQLGVSALFVELYCDATELALKDGITLKALPDGPNPVEMSESFRDMSFGMYFAKACQAKDISQGQYMRLMADPALRNRKLDGITEVTE